jgi:hypothetical protein
MIGAVVRVVGLRRRRSTFRSSVDDAVPRPPGRRCDPGTFATTSGAGNERSVLLDVRVRGVSATRRPTAAPTVPEVRGTRNSRAAPGEPTTRTETEHQAGAERPAIPTAMTGPLTITRERTGTNAHLPVAGALDIATTADLHQHIRPHLLTGCAEITFSTSPPSRSSTGRFRRRGRSAVRTERRLILMTHNLTKLPSHRRTPATA